MVTTFRDLIARNRRNSFLLVLGFILFVTVVAMVLALAIFALIDPEAASQLDWRRGLIVGGIAGGVSFLITLVSYYQGANLILAVSGAKEIQHDDDPQLFNVVEEMAIAAGVPMPRVYLINDSAPNAFATGRDPKHGIVAITTGLRDKLNREELQGVIAHEIAHIRNYDIRLMLLLAVLIGTVAMLADFFMQMMWYSGGHRRRSSRRDSDKGGGAAAVILVAIGVVLAIVAPILARIIQLAVSRQREYLADASAVEFTRNPLGLAGALRKIDEDDDVLEAANRGTAHLFIANPIKKFEARANSVFASHPPIGKRIRRLEKLAKVYETEEE
jgi:heat shock protein HtpX